MPRPHRWTYARRLALLPLLLVLGLVLAFSVPHAETGNGRLSENQTIQSQTLGYKLQYRVYLPDGYDDAANLPVLYLTDGQWYIGRGEVPQLLDRLIAEGAINPVIAVFVDNRDPDNLAHNRRNQQFFCNRHYIRFFTDELAQEIDTCYKTQAERTSRVILGLSFGGLNSACFGLHAHATFEGIAMQSPAMHPVPSLLSAYEDSTRLPLKIFLSSGTKNDNEARTRHLKRILEDKGYQMSYVEVPYGHEWANWKPLLDDVLRYYFGS